MRTLANHLERELVESVIMDPGTEPPPRRTKIDTVETTAFPVHEQLHKIAIKSTSAEAATLHATMHA